MGVRVHTRTCTHMCTYVEVGHGSSTDPHRSILNCCVGIAGLAALMKMRFYKYKNLWVYVFVGGKNTFI